MQGQISHPSRIQYCDKVVYAWELAFTILVYDYKLTDIVNKEYIINHNLSFRNGFYRASVASSHVY